MHLESEHFIVDKVKHTDKENLKLVRRVKALGKNNPGSSKCNI